MVLAKNVYFNCRMELQITATVAFVLWFTVTFQNLRKRGVIWCLARTQHWHFLLYKMLQAQEFIAPVTAVIKFCGNVLPNILNSAHR